MGWIANFQGLLDSWAGIDLVQESVHIASENEKQLADLNRKQLYEKGETADGKKLKTYRNRKYAQAKHDMNPLPGFGVPDFFVTGEFQRSIFVDARDTGTLIFDAADPKVEWLVKRDGESIFGLDTDNTLTAWSGIIKPPLVQRIAVLTGAKLI